MTASPFTANVLRGACIARALHVTAADEVSSDVAAELLGMAAKTLRNWRYGAAEDQPAWSVRSGRAWYRLEDLAQYLNSRRRAA